MKRCIFFLMALVLVAAPAGAIDIQNFNTAIGSNNLFSIYQSAPLEPWQVVIGGSVNVAGDPLTFTLPDEQEVNVVQQMMGNQFYIAFGLAGYVDIGVGGSYNRIGGEDLDQGFVVSPRFSDDNDITYIGAGDVRTVVRVRALENKPGSVGLAFVPFANFPTGNSAYYNGAGATDFGGLLVLDKRFDRVNIVFNAGYKYKGISEGEDGLDVIPADEILMGMGINIYAHRILDLVAEVNGKTVDYDLDNVDPEVPIEIIGGVKLYGGYGMSFLVGAGGGVTSGIGSPSYRALFGFEITYPRIDRTPPMLVRGGPAVDPDDKVQDTDRDGLSNWDENNIYGTDFMNPDSDGDGLKDGEEIATFKSDPIKKDTDGDELSDGAEIKLYGTDPRLPDSDGDTLADGVEVLQLRTDPTTKDTDNDKVPDNLDGAPLQAETYNSYQDQDGVPEITLAKRPSGVIMFENVIWLPAKLTWAGKKQDKIGTASTPMVNDIAVMLTEYPDLKVQIEDHVARGGNEAKNKTLTQAHADAVRSFLINKGIDAKRLTAIGRGSDFPVASNSTPEGRAKNTRTEFVIVEK